MISYIRGTLLKEEHFCKFILKYDIKNYFRQFTIILIIYFQWNTTHIDWCVCVCVCVCVFILFHRRGFSWLKQNNKCNARDQASDAVLRKSLCVKYIHHHIIDNHSRDLQASNCARVSIKPGGATRNKRQLLELSENQQ